MRAVISAILIVLGCVAAPLALTGLWVAGDIADTDRYVGNMAPLATDPDIREEVVEHVTVAITGPLRKRTPSPAEDLVRTLVEGVVAGEGFPTLWEDANRVAHRQLVAVLSGDGGQGAPEDGTVSIDLTPVYDRVRAPVDDLMKQELGAPLPALRPVIELSSSADLVRVRAVYTWSLRLKWVLPVLSVAFLVAGVALAGDRMRALLGAGLGLAASMLVLAAGLAVIRDVYLPEYLSSAMSDAAATTVFDTLTGSLRAGLRVIFAVGLALAGTAFFLAHRARRAGRRHQPAAPANDVAAG
ncbi:hypothetical protein [Streptosporangium sp. NPDC003464]